MTRTKLAARKSAGRNRNTNQVVNNTNNNNADSNNNSDNQNSTKSNVVEQMEVEKDETTNNNSNNKDNKSHNKSIKKRKRDLNSNHSNLIIAPTTSTADERIHRAVTAKQIYFTVLLPVPMVHLTDNTNNSSIQLLEAFTQLPKEIFTQINLILQPHVCIDSHHYIRDYYYKGTKNNKIPPPGIRIARLELEEAYHGSEFSAPQAEVPYWQITRIYKFDKDTILNKEGPKSILGVRVQRLYDLHKINNFNQLPPEEYSQLQGRRCKFKDLDDVIPDENETQFDHYLYYTSQSKTIQVAKVKQINLQPIWKIVEIYQQNINNSFNNNLSTDLATILHVGKSINKVPFSCFISSSHQLDSDLLKSAIQSRNLSNYPNIFVLPCLTYEKYQGRFHHGSFKKEIIKNIATNDELLTVLQRTGVSNLNVKRAKNNDKNNYTIQKRVIDTGVNDEKIDLANNGGDQIVINDTSDFNNMPLLEPSTPQTGDNNAIAAESKQNTSMQLVIAEETNIETQHTNGKIEDGEKKQEIETEEENLENCLHYFVFFHSGCHTLKTEIGKNLFEVYIEKILSHFSEYNDNPYNTRSKTAYQHYGILSCSYQFPSSPVNKARNEVMKLNSKLCDKLNKFLSTTANSTALVNIGFLMNRIEDLTQFQFDKTEETFHTTIQSYMQRFEDNSTIPVLTLRGKESLIIMKSFHSTGKIADYSNVLYNENTIVDRIREIVTAPDLIFNVNNVVREILISVSKIYGVDVGNIKTHDIINSLIPIYKYYNPFVSPSIKFTTSIQFIQLCREFMRLVMLEETTTLYHSYWAELQGVVTRTVHPSSGDKLEKKAALAKFETKWAEIRQKITSAFRSYARVLTDRLNMWFLSLFNVHVPKITNSENDKNNQDNESFISSANTSEADDKEGDNPSNMQI